MAEAKKCDRCGKLYEKYYNKDNSVILAKIDYDHCNQHDGPVLNQIVYDLCPDCMSDFRNWIRH